MNNFTWTDLSTFDREKTKEFYSTLFGWIFIDEQKQNKQDYSVAYKDGLAVAGVYTMPQKFTDMGMPSFWMSYVRVENIKEALDRATQIKGIRIEIGITLFGSGKMALVRDPSGAGFTLYEGKDLQGRQQKEHCFSWNVHHVKDVSIIREFYEKVLGWEIQKTSEPTIYRVYNHGKYIADIEEQSEAVRGSFQYWMPVISIVDIDITASQIENLGGNILVKLNKNQYICSDPQGGSFIISNIRKH